MNVVSVIGIALIAAALIALLRKYIPEFALPVSLAAALVIFAVLIAQTADIFTEISAIADKAGISNNNIKILFKTLGIAYIVQLAKDTCNDSGETALSNRVDMAGKIAIAALSLPLIKQVLEIITQLLK